MTIQATKISNLPEEKPFVSVEKTKPTASSKKTSVWANEDGTVINYDFDEDGKIDGKVESTVKDDGAKVNTATCFKKDGTISQIKKTTYDKNYNIMLTIIQ